MSGSQAPGRAVTTGPQCGTRALPRAAWAAPAAAALLRPSVRGQALDLPLGHVSSGWSPCGWSTGPG